MTTTTPELPPCAILDLTEEDRAKMIAYVENQMLQPQWPFDQAAQLTGLPAELLRKLVRDGVLSGNAPWRVNGDVVGWCDIDQARGIASTLATARRPVEGVGILATEAAEKYGFDPQTIYNWYNNGWVRLVDSPGKRNRQFNEGDIAFAKAIAELTGKRQNIFPAKPRSGRPPKK